MTLRIIQLSHGRSGETTNKPKASSAASSNFLPNSQKRKSQADDGGDTFDERYVDGDQRPHSPPHQHDRTLLRGVVLAEIANLIKERRMGEDSFVGYFSSFSSLDLRESGNTSRTDLCSHGVDHVFQTLLRSRRGGVDAAAGGMNAGGDGDDLSQRGKLIVPKLFPFGGMGGGETGGGIGREENDRIGGNLAQAMLDEEPAQRIPRTLQQVSERFGIDDA